MDNSEYSVNTYQHYVMCFSLLLVHMYGMENSSVAAVLYWVLYRETEHPDRTEEARTGCRYTASTQFPGHEQSQGKPSQGHAPWAWWLSSRSLWQASHQYWTISCCTLRLHVCKSKSKITRKQIYRFWRFSSICKFCFEWQMMWDTSGNQGVATPRRRLNG